MKILNLYAGINLDKYDVPNRLKEKMINNCVEPETGKQILDYVINPIEIQKTLL